MSTSITTQLNNTIGLDTSGKSSSAATTNTASNSAADASKLMGTTDQFIKILLAQLKYQDPTQPMKGTEFIDSISRLSGVEQNINTNKNLENIASILTSNNSRFGSPVSYVDKTINFNSSQIVLKDKMSSFSYDLDPKTPPNNVSMVIKDASGNVVVNVQATNHPGTNSVKWDGTDSAGNQLPDGLYTVSVQYPDPATQNSAKPTSIEIPVYTSGKVTAADFTGAEPLLIVDGISIPLTAIRSLQGAGV